MIMRLKPDEEFIYKCITSQNLGLGRNGKIKIALLDEKNFWDKYLPIILKEEAGNDIAITDEKIQILKQMYQKNSSVLEKINIKMQEQAEWEDVTKDDFAKNDGMVSTSERTEAFYQLKNIRKNEIDNDVLAKIISQI